MAYLKHRFNGQAVSLYELSEDVVIGRRPDCHIRIDDPTISGTHARIEKRGDVWQLSDLESTNGVIVKGKPVSSVALQPGTVFALGTHEFEFSLELPSGLDRTLKIKKSWIPGVYYTK